MRRAGLTRAMPVIILDLVHTPLASACKRVDRGGLHLKAGVRRRRGQAHSVRSFPEVGMPPRMPCKSAATSKGRNDI